jgi:TfoX N-terminal domain
VAYDEVLANRVRELVADELGLSEIKMFGGLAFLVNGNMAVSASGRGGLMLRVDPTAGEDLVAGSPARVIEMRGRAMPGWLFVETAHLGTKKVLSEWVERGVSYARSLPPKR